MCSCRQTGRDALLSEAYGLVWASDEDNGTVTIPASVLVAPTIGRRSQGHGRASEPWAPSAAIGRFPSCWTFSKPMSRSMAVSKSASGSVLSRCSWSDLVSAQGKTSRDVLVGRTIAPMLRLLVVTRYCRSVFGRTRQATSSNCKSTSESPSAKRISTVGGNDRIMHGMWLTRACFLREMKDTEIPKESHV
jgi:hypothetical protein